MIQPLDIVCILVIIIFVFRSFMRGFIAEFAGWAALILGFLSATLFSGLVARILDSQFGPMFWNQIIAFLALFIVTYLIVKLFEAGLKNLIERAHLQNLDKALGLLLGIVESALIIFLILFVIQILQPFLPIGNVLMESFFGQLFIPLFPYAEEIINRGINV